SKQRPCASVAVAHVPDTCRAFRVSSLHVLKELLDDKPLDVVFIRRPDFGLPVPDRIEGTSLHHQVGGPGYEKVGRDVDNSLPPLDRLDVEEVHSSSYRSSSRI